MMYKNEITITREEFHDTLSTLVAELASDPLDALKFAMLCAKAELEFFSEEDDNTDTEAPFKVGDTVFVTDNEGDGNCIVNQVVTVTKVRNDACVVTNGDIHQMINFKNLRKVKAS